jgi:acetamidase/formamidase
MTVHVFRPGPDEYAYTFGGHPPVLTAAPGDVIDLTTEDCFGGKVRSVDDLPSRVCRMPFLNPVTGPFYIYGAEPGDTLAVHFASIIPARPEGWSSTFPHFGALTATHTTAMLHPPLEERVWRYPIDTVAGTVRYQARRSAYAVDLPLEPMHGTAGVAPAAGEVRSTLVPDLHGGNLDTPELQPGTTLYLGVNVDGAMFAVGDGHARQGHGEACGVAVECAMHTRIIVDVIKATGTPVPRLESDTAIMSIGVARPLEDAYRMSHTDLIDWTTQLTSLDHLDAYQLVSQAGQAPIGNVCDPNYTIVAKLPKTYLIGAVAYGGVHNRLRAIAAGLDQPGTAP